MYSLSASQRLFAVIFALLLAGCASQSPSDTAKVVPPTHTPPSASATTPHKQPAKIIPRPKPQTAPELVSSLLPANLADKGGWAADIVAAFDALGIAPNKSNICAVLAEIEQESSFQAEPVVFGLPKIVRQELEARRKKYGVPQWLMDKSLARKSPNGLTYSERIDALKTETDVNNLYEDIISEIPMGKKLFADYNPVRTAGPMQVSMNFANSYAATRRYPYAHEGSLRNALFTRKGGLYFGVAYLLDYPANYDSMNFRFADFNAGRYSSRNAAFQNAVSSLSGIPLTPDGDLLSYADGVAREEASQTMQALLAISGRLKLDRAEILRNLLLEKSPDFEQSPVYTRVFALAPGMPRARIPEIEVRSPKFTRKLTTTSYAKRVDGRYKNCLKK
ncbi:MAG TPA: DUF1615 domain-containing protein [Gallionella sp.]|nr:DUF1615 domain-containing protein [Gallionella sp.]